MNLETSFNAEQEARCLQLVSDVCNNRASDAEFAELESMLRDSAEARRVYRSYLNLHAGLHRFFRSEAMTATAEETPIPLARKNLPPIRPPRSRTPHGPFWIRHPQATAFAASAVLMMSVIFGMLAYLQKTWDQSGREGGVLFTRGGAVAAIGQVDETAWQPGHILPTRVGAELEAGGVIRIASGRLRLDFFSGAMVLLEGPAELELHSAKGGRLIQGRLSAVVPPAAKGFRIQTPSSTVIDLGTEFGVHANAAGDSELHVFEGMVSLVVGKGDSPVQVMDLSAGQARRVIAASGIVEQIASSEKAFARIADLTPRYELAVRQTRPVAYWRFEDETPGELKSALLSSYDLKPHGIQIDDRGPELGGNAVNRCVYFDGRQARMDLSGPNPVLRTGRYSVVMWVRPEGAGAQNIFTGTASDGPLVHWSQQLRLTRDRQFEHYGFDHVRPATPGGQYVTMTRPEPVQLGRWYHVVFTGENGGRMQLFIDGKPAIAPIQAPQRFQQVIDRFTLGAPSGGSAGDQAMRAFEGAIDELALYDRVLTPEEVRDLFQAAGR